MSVVWHSFQRSSQRSSSLAAGFHMEIGAGSGIDLPDAAYAGVAIAMDQDALVGDADVVLAVQA